MMAVVGTVAMRINGLQIDVSYIYVSTLLRGTVFFILCHTLLTVQTRTLFSIFV